MGATLMGIGICAMHYTGMIAMRMSPPIQFEPPLFIASVLIAISSSLAALWIAFRLRK
jgi:NO-binding membrane sensor protein with MHYT domain